MTSQDQNILVLGATGYLGEAVSRGLLAAGHTVHSVVREQDDTRLPAGVVAHQGDATDADVLAGVVTDDIDAVVNLLPPVGAEVDLATTSTLLTLLAARPGRTYVYGSGVWVLGPTTAGHTADERTPTRPLDLVAHRPAVEDLVLGAAGRGVRGLVVRPGVVHGDGRGIPALLVDLASQHGHGVFVGDEPARWPMVHRDDLADLVTLALEKAPAEGGVLHAVAEPAVDLRALAGAAATVAGVDDTARPWPLAEAAEHLGAAFAEALACDQHVDSPAAFALGWTPSRPGAVDDMLGALAVTGR